MEKNNNNKLSQVQQVYGIKQDISSFEKFFKCRHQEQMLTNSFTKLILHVSLVGTG